MAGEMTTYLTNLRNELRDPTTFATRVVPNRAAQGLGWSLLVVGGILLAIKLLFIWQNMFGQFTWVKFWALFFHTETQSSRGSVWQFVATWGSIILIPLAIAILVYAAVTKNTAVQKLYTDFQERGYVVAMEPVGISIQNGNTQVPVHLISHPTVSDEDFQSFLEFIRTDMANPQHTTLKQLRKDLSSKHVQLGIPVQEFYPNAPMGLRLYATSLKPGTYALIETGPENRGITVHGIK